ncbi:MAG: hypothetical protein WD738_21165 [Pirellulales bacterium]
MASPFRIFRKYQKTLLVVAGVILMFVFVIGDALVGYLGGSRRGRGDATIDADAVAVHWDDDSLTNRQLHNLVMRRGILNGFIQGVEFEGRRAAFEAGIEPRNLRVEPILGPETPQQGVERSVVQTRLFAEAARKAGMRISDDTIVQYLDELGRGRVTRDDMRAMLSRMQSGGSGASIDYVIEALREEMLARNFIASHQFAFDTVTPQQRWEDWLSVNDRVVIEAAAIPMERFLVDVPEPTDAELVAFFDKHKNREPQPDFIGQMELPSATPGFRVPRKIDVQFIRANYDQYLSKLEGEIRDEEVQKYYDENKDPLFIKADTGLIDASSEDEDAQRESDAKTEEAAEEAPGQTPSGETTDETSGEEGAIDTETNDSVETSDAEQTDGQTPPPMPEETAPSDGPGAEAAPNEGDQSSRKMRSNGKLFRLAAFLQEADAENAPPGETEAADPAADVAENASADAAAPTSESAPSASAEPPAEKADAAEPAAETPAATPAAEEKPKEFQPLEEVRDVIRRELAGRRAAEQLNELMNQLASELNSEFNTYFGQVLNAQAEEKAPPSPPPALADLEPLAKKHGLEHGKTGPVSLLELRDLVVGKSGNSDTGVALWQDLFLNRDWELYQPIITVDVDGNRFLAMKTSDTPGRVPDLAEVKEEVVRAWKREQAAELARKYAEEQAKKAQESSSTLADFFAGQESVEILRTDPFSHYTGGDVAFVNGQYQQEPFRLSEPDGVVAPGPDFLQRVSELKDGEIGAVLNHDHSVAYVVRIVEHQDSPDELRSAYLSEANSWPGLRIMTGTHARVAAAHLVNDIVTSAGLTWERPFDQPAQDEEEAG